MNKRISTKLGFTLIELLVVLAIIGIVSVIGLFSYRSNGVQANLDAIAHTIDLTIREAQVNARSVKVYTGGSAPTFDVAYGVAMGNNNNEDNGIILFAKVPTVTNGKIEYPTGFDFYTNGTGAYDHCTKSEGCIVRHAFPSGYKIENGGLCVTNNPSAVTCTPPVSGYNQVTLMFRKASSTPIITQTSGPNSLDNTYAEIKVIAPNGTDFRKIKVWATGATEITNS